MRHTSFRLLMHLEESMTCILLLGCSIISQGVRKGHEHGDGTDELAYAQDRGSLVTAVASQVLQGYEGLYDGLIR